MLLDISLILAPLFLGYLVPLRSKRLVYWINVCSHQMVYIILFLMGYGLAFIDNLNSNLVEMLTTSAAFIITLGVFNLLGLYLIHGRLAMPQPSHRSQGEGFSIKQLKDSLQLVGVVVLGFVIATLRGQRLPMQEQLADYALMLLLLLIGSGLRSSGIALYQILLNRRGFTIAMVVILTSIPAALISAWLLDIPKSLALAMASGFGWYSLSGILLSDGANVLMGGATFFIDLGRELIAIMLIPLLMPKCSTAAIGYAGATAMDFTLPVLQKTGGANQVPIAIVSGFLLSLACPLLIALCLSFYTP
jgi:uncharacterized membrane protein YbjE (DUF340 family)